MASDWLLHSGGFLTLVVVQIQRLSVTSKVVFSSKSRPALPEWPKKVHKLTFFAPVLRPVVSGIRKEFAAIRIVFPVFSPVTA